VPGEGAGTGEAAGAELACVLRHGERELAPFGALGELLAGRSENGEERERERARELRG